MKTAAVCLAILCAMFAERALAANKSVTRNDADKTITVQTRTLPPIDRYQTIHRLRDPAPPNACPAQNALEILNPASDERRCVRVPR